MATALTDQELRTLLMPPKRIAVIGLSPVAGRPSFGVARYLQSQGYEIFGVRPASPPEVLGRPCVATLQDLAVDVDIIDVFRNSDAIPAVVDEIEQWQASRPADRRPPLLWLQEGIHHPEAEAKAERLGFQVVSNRCLLKEHRRLFS